MFFFFFLVFSTDFASLLGSGTLVNKSSVKVCYIFCFCKLFHAFGISIVVFK